MTLARGAVKRDRRDQTTQQILIAARRLVTAGDREVSLRAVAREMGVTAPALYRYYPSYDALLAALAATLYDEVVAAMESAQRDTGAESVAEQLACSASAFRAWALAHRREFALIFANPVQPGAANPSGDDAVSRAGARFGGHFAALFVRLWRERGFPTPEPDGLDPAVRTELAGIREQVAPGLPPEALWVFIRQWARLYGAVTIEVSGQLAWAVREGTDAFFAAMMRDNLVELGLDPSDVTPESGPSNVRRR